MNFLPNFMKIYFRQTCPLSVSYIRYLFHTLIKFRLIDSYSHDSFRYIFTSSCLRFPDGAVFDLYRRIFYPLYVRAA